MGDNENNVEEMPLEEFPLFILHVALVENILGKLGAVACIRMLQTCRFIKGLIEENPTGKKVCRFAIDQLVWTTNDGNEGLTCSNFDSAHLNVENLGLFKVAIERFLFCAYTGNREAAKPILNHAVIEKAMKQLEGLQITSRSLEITNYNLDNSYTLVDAWEALRATELIISNCQNVRPLLAFKKAQKIHIKMSSEQEKFPILFTLFGLDSPVIIAEGLAFSEPDISEQAKIALHDSLLAWQSGERVIKHILFNLRNPHSIHPHDAELLLDCKGFLSGPYEELHNADRLGASHVPEELKEAADFSITIYAVTKRNDKDSILIVLFWKYAVAITELAPFPDTSAFLHTYFTLCKQQSDLVQPHSFKMGDLYNARI